MKTTTETIHTGYERFAGHDPDCSNPGDFVLCECQLRGRRTRAAFDFAALVPAGTYAVGRKTMQERKQAQFVTDDEVKNPLFQVSARFHKKGGPKMKYSTVVPAGAYAVDAEALREARRGVPSGEYHVDAEALREARRGVPSGEYHSA